MKEQIVKISTEYYNELQRKAEQWDVYQAGLKHRADHLNNISKAERSARAKKAVQAREDKKLAVKDSLEEDLRKGSY